MTAKALYLVLYSSRDHRETADELLTDPEIEFV